jgi:hypothetical protein
MRLLSEPSSLSALLTIGVDVAVGAISLALELELMRIRLRLLWPWTTGLLLWSSLSSTADLRSLSTELEIDLMLIGDRDLVLDLSLRLECALDLE